MHDTVSLWSPPHRVWLLLFLLQGTTSTGRPSRPAAAAVAGGRAVCVCELRPAADLLHSADAPTGSGRPGHAGCQVGKLNKLLWTLSLSCQAWKETYTSILFMPQVWDRSGRCGGQCGSLLSDRHSGLTAGGRTDQESSLGSVTNTLKW